MKKIILLITSILILQSCYTLQGIKKPIVLVDAPKNTTVSNNGVQLDIEDVTAFRSESSSGSTNHVTLYKYPGVKVKLKKNTTLELKSGDKKSTVIIKTKPGIVVLIVEGIFTFGIATLVDLATGSYWYTKNKFVDVPASLDTKTPRTEKELKKKVSESLDSISNINLFASV